MSKIPKYRKHAQRDIGFVEMGGNRHYLPGKYNSGESIEAYAALVKKFQSGDFDYSPQYKLGVVTVGVLVGHFLEWAKHKYQKNGRSTGTYEKFKHIIVPALTRSFFQVPVEQFGPNALKKVRLEFLTKGNCRKEINRRTNLVRRIFNWGVGEELVPVNIAHSLKYVSAIHLGETTAPERAAVVGVPDEIINLTLPHLPTVIADMVRIQRLTAMRPTELFLIRWRDIDESDAMWVYRPSEHKNEHKHKIRPIALNKTVQHILHKYRYRPENEFIFTPEDSFKQFTEKRRLERQSPVQPSQVARGKKKSRRKFTPRFNRTSYRQAIVRACGRAGVPHWTPYQIRHTAASEVDRILGREAAQALLGHSQINTTTIYIDKTESRVKEVAQQLEQPISRHN